MQTEGPSGVEVLLAFGPLLARFFSRAALGVASAAPGFPNPLEY